MNAVIAVIIIFAAACVIAAAVFVLCEHRKTKETIARINAMLDSAIDGSFTESSFDESVMSALESKLWRYLSSSEISARRTAEEKDKIKTLIADISHQTKTPLSNIQLYSELMAEQELSAEARECAEKINTQAEKLNFLITSLVKLSRLETGIIALSPKRNSIAPLLDEIASEYSANAEKKGLYLNVKNAETEAVFDEKWTAEAVGNIVDNAIKYTENGGIDIAVKEYEMFVCVEVRDTGIGIPEEEQAKIFGRFCRAESASGKSGVGIGLYLAREIMSGQNGYIKVSSEVGKGTVFSVFLSKQ